MGAIRPTGLSKIPKTTAFIVMKKNGTATRKQVSCCFGSLVSAQLREKIRLK